MVFALPVVGAIFLSRWQPYLMALLSIVRRGCRRARASTRVALVRAGTQHARRLARDGAGPGHRRQPTRRSPASMRPPATSWCCSKYSQCWYSPARSPRSTSAPSSSDCTRKSTLRAPRPNAARSSGQDLIEDLPLPALLLDADTAEHRLRQHRRRKILRCRADEWQRPHRNDPLLLPRCGAGAHRRRRRCRTALHDSGRRSAACDRGSREAHRSQRPPLRAVGRQ